MKLFYNFFAIPSLAILDSFSRYFETKEKVIRLQFKNFREIRVYCIVEISVHSTTLSELS